MTAVSLLWDTTMANVTWWENALDLTPSELSDRWTRRLPRACIGVQWSNVYSYSILRIRETDQDPGREGGFYLSTIFSFCCTDDKGHFPVKHQEGDPSSTQLKTKKRHTFVLAMYIPAVISLCLTCCTLYTCKISPPPNSTSFSGWQCSKKSTGKLTVVDFTLVLVAFFLRTGFTILSGL